jgi:hypothetical protein
MAEQLQLVAAREPERAFQELGRAVRERIVCALLRELELPEPSNRSSTRT